MYALVSGFGLYAFFELWDQKLWVLCCVLPVFALCLWADLKKRKTLRAEITARLGAGLVSGEARPQLCAEALRGSSARTRLLLLRVEEQRRLGKDEMELIELKSLAPKRDAGLLVFSLICACFLNGLGPVLRHSRKNSREKVAPMLFQRDVSFP